MSQINQLPMKFKLFLKEEHVGFLEWKINKIKCSRFHGCLSSSISAIDGKETTYWIGFDDMHQSTGFHDIHGEEIFFGDKLKVGKSLIVTVILDDSKYICASNHDSSIVFDTDIFYEMELVK